MTALAMRYAIVGQSFPRETFPDLQPAALPRRLLSRAQQARGVWQSQREPVVMPERLRA